MSDDVDRCGQTNEGFTCGLTAGHLGWHSVNEGPQSLRWSGGLVVSPAPPPVQESEPVADSDYDRCGNCHEVIQVMAFKGTGFCCAACVTADRHYHEDEALRAKSEGDS